MLRSCFLIVCVVVSSAAGYSQALHVGIHGAYQLSRNATYGSGASDTFYFPDGVIGSIKPKPWGEIEAKLPDVVRLGIDLKYDFRNHWYVNGAFDLPTFEPIAEFAYSEETFGSSFTEDVGSYRVTYVMPSITAGYVFNPRNQLKFSVIGGFSSMLVVKYGDPGVSEGFEEWLHQNYMGGFKNNTYYARVGAAVHFYNFSLSAFTDRSIGTIDYYNGERYATHSNVFVSLSVNLVTFNF